jgi:hypothetical protein
MICHCDGDLAFLGLEKAQDHNQASGVKREMKKWWGVVNVSLSDSNL